MTTFNLQKHLDKIAKELPTLTKQSERSYEGVQGYFVAQTRSWQNCSRKKMLKGSTAQEAWQSCLDEYQKMDDNIDWVEKNALEDSLELQKNAQSTGSMMQMGSYLEKIKKHRAEGKSIGQSVMAALKDCETEATKIKEASVKSEIKIACGGCGCGDHGNSHKCKCSDGCACKKDGGTCCQHK